MVNYESKLSESQLSDVNRIIFLMKCDPKPTINEFLNTIAKALDAGLIKEVVV